MSISKLLGCCCQRSTMLKSPPPPPSPACFVRKFDRVICIFSTELLTTSLTTNGIYATTTPVRLNAKQYCCGNKLYVCIYECVYVCVILRMWQIVADFLGRTDNLLFGDTRQNIHERMCLFVSMPLPQQLAYCQTY